MSTLRTEDVYPNQNQPRKLFEPKALDELAASIRAAGRLIQPILVRPDGAGRYEIVAGERRWRAHLLLGWTEIDAVVDTDMTDEQRDDAAIIENLQRKDITPLEEARAFQRRLDAGLTVDELAARLGLKQPWRITERTALLRLTSTMQMALACGVLTPSQAFEMSRLEPVGQQRLFDAIREGRCASYAALRKVTGALLDAQNQIGMFAEPEPPTEEEKERASRLERAIEAAAKIVTHGFDGNDCIALERVSRQKASQLAAELELIERSLRDIRLNLGAALVANAPRKAA